MVSYLAPFAKEQTDVVKHNRNAVKISMIFFMVILPLVMQFHFRTAVALFQIL
jgi:hypothetical protein